MEMATYFSKQEGEIDMQEQTSWSSTVVVHHYFTSEAQTPTYVEIFLFTRSIARMRYFKCVHYGRTTDISRTGVVCWLP